MRIAIFGKAVSPNDAEALREAFQRVLQLDASPWISQAYLSELNDHMAVPDAFRAFDGEVPEGTELLLAFGGDGTVLEAATLVRQGKVPILGVNTGRLGFLSNVAMEEFDLAMDALWPGRPGPRSAPCWKSTSTASRCPWASFRTPSTRW